MKDSPRWRTEFREKPIDFEVLRAETNKVGMPTMDPVFGKAGPLVALWGKYLLTSFF